MVLKRGDIKKQKKENEHPHLRHIRHLKHHRNALYIVVFITLILQIITLTIISSQISQISAQQGVIKEDIDNYVADLEFEIDGVRQENQFGISELSKEISFQEDLITKQSENLEQEINKIKAAQEDFSGIIEDVIFKVVNVRTDKAAGTGFFVNSEGFIITNQHVIKDAQFVQVQTFDDMTFDAQIVFEDTFSDLALLQIPLNFEELKFANSDEIQIGEKVIAIGNPLGLSFTVTEGIVSATKRFGPNGLQAYVQTDVTLNPGNSGGPLINTDGEVIGINNFKIGGAEALGFALESNYIKNRINELLGAELIK